jgi:hypothetical protein
MSTHHLPPHTDPAARADLPPGTLLPNPSLEERTMPPWDSNSRHWAGWPVVGIALIALGTVAALNFVSKHEGEERHAVVATVNPARAPVVPPSDAAAPTPAPADAMPATVAPGANKAQQNEALRPSSAPTEAPKDGTD